MGKIRVKSFGDETVEQEEQKKAKKRQEAKKVGKAPGLKGGERINVVGPTEEELEAMAVTPEPSAAEEPKEEKKAKKQQKKTKSKSTRSKKYKEVKTQVDRSKTYRLSDALELLPKVKLSKMDETVELHLNTIDKGISGNVTLPHGTGKKTRVAIADDKLIADVEKGVIAFDVLVAAPQMMPKLAKVARVLGPKGLMPNPKNGTVSQNPEEVVKKFEGGQMSYKTESKFPIIHLTVGKLSFGDKKLTENIS